MIAGMTRQRSLAGQRRQLARATWGHTGRPFAMPNTTNSPGHTPPPECAVSLRNDRLALKCGTRLVFVAADEVDSIHADGVYVRVHTADRSFLVRQSLTGLEEALGGSPFIRIHRSTMVNIRRVLEVAPQKGGGWEVVMQDGRRLSMSRTYRTRLTSMLG